MRAYAYFNQCVPSGVTRPAAIFVSRVEGGGYVAQRATQRAGLFSPKYF